MSLIVSPAAEADIDEIWDYSADNWSVAQADAYLTDLRRMLERIALNPAIGAPCPRVRPGYRKQSCGSHLIFYRQIGEDVDVVRILHQRMDFARHL
ncbi:MAG: type II toxin-antitoxin system RelE/ParE family toxin [Caulobacter sp.]|nr:type II toxin-antitoxin system RelE/ParE family toxin [Caulobacter sp.]